jgi:hypothetical protein
MTKSDMFLRFENDYSDLQFCHFCVAQNIKYLKLIFCTFVGYIFDYVWIFLQNFLKLKNMIFIFFKKRDHLCPCAPNLCPRFLPYKQKLHTEYSMGDNSVSDMLILVPFCAMCSYIIKMCMKKRKNKTACDK